MDGDSHQDCACGRHYDAERWAALPLFVRIVTDETPGPDQLVVEVRVCTSCERHIVHLTGSERTF